jgi:hypothetical protein
VLRGVRLGFCSSRVIIFSMLECKCNRFYDGLIVLKEQVRKISIC